jgi:hypothetical protein
MPGDPQAAADLESWTSALALGAILVVAIVVLAIAGRGARPRSALLWIPAGMERITGIPGWAGCAFGLGAWSLLFAGAGFYNDVAWHVGRGRDEDVFTAPHTMIVVGLGGIALAAAVGILFATLQRVDTKLRFKNLRIPYSMLPLGLLGVCALSGFPLDELWHRAYGVDVTMWSPTHLLMICGAVFSLVAGMLVLAEANVEPRRNGWTRFAYGLAGLLVLAGFNALLGEFRFGVPQFQQLYHPVLLAITSAFTFTALRLALGRWWGIAIAAVTFLPELVGLSGTGGTTTDFVPTRATGMFLVSAIIVELVAAVAGTERRVRFAVLSGVGVATLGFAGEYAWNQGASQPWRPVLIPDALLVGTLGGVGAAVLAVTYARAAGRMNGPRLGRPLVAAAAIAVVAAMLLPLPRRAPAGTTAAIDVTTRDDGRADIAVQLTPADAADDARWFQVMAWQGDGFEVTELEEVGPGQYVAEDAMPVVGRWKTVLRLHRGAELLSAPIYLPEDVEIGVEEVPVEDRTIELADETSILMREVKDGPATTAVIAYTLIAGVAAAWVAAFALAVRRIGDLDPRASEVRGAGRTVRPSTATPQPV